MVRYISDRIAVLYLGQVMELGPAAAVFDGPHHPYTAALLSSVLSLDAPETERLKLAGEVPSVANPPSGCVFHTRCPHKIGAICESQAPPMAELESGRAVRCHLTRDQLLRSVKAGSELPASA